MNLFLSNVAVSTKQVVILYILVLVGFLADRFHIYTEETAKKTNDLLFNIITPCVIVNSFITTEFTPERGKSFAIGVLISLGTHVLGMIFASLFFNKSKHAAIYKFACVYANVGYMGIPLTAAVLGSEGVFYASTAVVVMNVLSFTQGVYIMSKKRKTDDGEEIVLSDDEKKKNRIKTVKGIFLNPGVIGVVIGMPLFFLGVKVPELIGKPIDMISSLMTPLAMIIVGTYISRADLKHIFSCGNRYLVSLIRLVLVPCVVLVVMKVIGLDEKMMTAAMIAAAAPSANSTVMFSVKYGKDTSEASQTITLITLISIITMPVMIALTKI